MKQVIRLLIVLILPCSVALAAGTLKGTITDENGESLIGAEIIVLGTYRGASTDMDGNYQVDNLPVGSHDIQVSMLGYTSILETAVIFPPEGVVNRSWTLNSTVLAAGEDVVIIGEKPLLDHDQTASATTLSAEDIGARVAENVVDIIQNSAGVVREKDEIHIRGGRAEENLYLIDNLSSRDPITGEAGGTFISTEAIKSVEVMTGGFSAEYGQAQSGVIKVETRDGGTKYSGSFKFKRDYLRDNYPHNAGVDIVEFTQGGPLPFSDQKLRYFINGYMNIGNTFLPHADKLAPLEPFGSWGLREENNYSGLLKLTWLPDPRLRLDLNMRQGISIHQGYEKSLMERRVYYPQSYEQILDNYNTFTDNSSQYSLTFKQTLSMRTFYELTVGNDYFDRYSSPGNKEWWELEKPLDARPIFYDYYPDGTVNPRIGDGFLEYGDGFFWHHHYSSIINSRGYISSKITESQLLKVGFEHRYTHLKLLDIASPWVRSTSSLGTDFDMYEIYTGDAAIYLTDHINFQGMIVDIGARLDLWLPGKFAERSLGDTVRINYSDVQQDRFLARTFNMFGYRSTAQLSPRLGVSHPVTDNDMLFFSYGHFSQLPKMAYVYAKMNTVAPSSSQVFGNPSLSPTSTVQFEVGLKHKFTENSVLTVTAFNKDMFNYIGVREVQLTEEQQQRGVVSLRQHGNLDYARSRGLELYFKWRTEQYYSGNLQLNYTVTRGTQSSTADLQEGTSRQSITDLGEAYLRWDRPLELSGYVSFNSGRPGDDPLRVFGVPFPAGISVDLFQSVRSGIRYSPMMEVDGEAHAESSQPYSGVTDVEFSTDLKISKRFYFGRRLNLRFFVEIENLMDAKIPNSAGFVNALTGRPWEEGDPVVFENRVYHNVEQAIQQGMMPPWTPARYEDPRQLFFGMSMSF